MKATGIVRKVDELGRVVLPKELRNVYDIKEKDVVEIFVDEDCIILKKYQCGLECKVTGEVSTKNMVLANGKIVLSDEGARYLFRELQKRFS